MTGHDRYKPWPGEPSDLWPAPEPPARHETRSDEARIRIIEQGLWIEHRQSIAAVQRCASFVARPWSPHESWRGLLFAGDPRSGRSSILRKALWKPHVDRFQRVPIVSMPTEPAEGAFWAAVAEARFHHAWRKASAIEQKARAMNDIARTGAIAFDGGDVLADLTRAQRRRMLSRIKGLGEEGHVPVILVASSKVAAAILSDEDWGGRFEASHLARFRIDRDWLDLLAAWEAALPLQEPSLLTRREMALHLYALSDGRIGRLAAILRDAAIAAVRSCTERITIAHLDNLGMAPPATFRGFPF